MEDGGLGTSEESDQRDLRQLGGETLVLWRTAASAHLLFMVAEREVPGIETVSLSLTTSILNLPCYWSPCPVGLPARRMLVRTEAEKMFLSKKRYTG